jgi:hypothetical protein
MAALSPPMPAPIMAIRSSAIGFDLVVEKQLTNHRSMLLCQL